MSRAARHLESVPVEALGRAGIDELLSRDDLADAAGLLRAVQADPYGPLAERVLEVCAHRQDPVAVVVPLVVGRWRAARPRQSVDLAALRRCTGRTQTEVAAVLRTGQSDLSKLERGRDPHLSTLARYVAALGGRLELAVRWPDGTTDHLQLAQVEDAVPRRD